MWLIAAAVFSFGYFPLCWRFPVWIRRVKNKTGWSMNSGWVTSTLLLLSASKRISCGAAELVVTRKLLKAEKLTTSVRFRWDFPPTLKLWMYVGFRHVRKEHPFISPFLKKKIILLFYTCIGVICTRKAGDFPQFLKVYNVTINYSHYSVLFWCLQT